MFIFEIFDFELFLIFAYWVPSLELEALANLACPDEVDDCKYVTPAELKEMLPSDLIVESVVPWYRRTRFVGLVEEF